MDIRTRTAALSTGMNTLLTAIKFAVYFFSGSLALLWTRSHGTEEPFISGDNNYFYPYIVLHYRVRDITLYL